MVLRMLVSGTDSTSPRAAHRRRRRLARSSCNLGALDVFGDDPALGSSAAQRRQLDAALARSAAGKRRGR